MERDRQGIDLRFGQSGEKISPPPLDVYQFIWDRTRMIRKDFILQNYTGTGGKCNAAAVRCHERIARWHCMCEHQLSHLPDYITMQSQQNIQELGQAMKTLNMYYDDADGRAVKEELVDSSANEQDGEAGNVLHGCRSNVVMGKNPIDYNDNPLSNDVSSSTKTNRIIGRISSTNGTAEPEMRGLYVLLTINNDGGMEVLKYSARLSEQSPDIFNSKPVQLALKVYKAKREYNYARFFSILRSSSTPYLFACIMFGYVAEMRKAAIRIMNCTFGSRRKDTGEGVYDSYPLQDLVRLLCFEDLEEAKEACLHYNITVKTVTHPKNPEKRADVIFWRNSDFKEKKDPSKGTVINLKPRKMNRIIESKLNVGGVGGTGDTTARVTKLAICRGEVSGDGATMAQPILRSPPKKPERNDSIKQLEEERIQREKLQKIEAERRGEMKRVQILIEEKKRQLEEARQKQIDQERREKEEREEKERMARRKAKEAEEVRRQKEAEKQRILQAQQEALRREAEEKKQVELERQRQAAEKIKRQQEMEQRRREMEKQRLEEEYRRKKEKERKEEEERQRQLQIERDIAEQLRRQKELEVQRAEEERKKAEKRKLDREWNSKIEAARKFLVLCRWREQLSTKHGQRLRTVRCLENLDPTGRPTISGSKRRYMDSIRTNYSQDQIVVKQPLHRSVTCEEFFYELSCDPSSQLDLGAMMDAALKQDSFWKHIEESRLSTREAYRGTFLFKLGIFVPSTERIQGQEQLTSMIKLWIDSRFKMNHVHCYDCDIGHQIRIVCTFVDTDETCDNFDAVMTIIPPTCAEQLPDARPSIENAFEITINLDDVEDIDATDFQHLLRDGCEVLFHEIIIMNASNYTEVKCDETSGMVLERLSLKQLCCILIKKAMWIFPDETNYLQGMPSHMQRLSQEDFGDRMIGYCFELLKELFEIINSLIHTCPKNWPGDEFSDADSDTLEGYFSNGEGLPMKWADFGSTSKLKDAVCDIFQSLETSTFLESFLLNLIDKAPPDTQGVCSELYNNREYRRCLEYALDWYDSNILNDYFLYLPLGVAKKAINDMIESNKKQLDKLYVEPVEIRLPISTNYATEEEEEQDTDIFVRREDLSGAKNGNSFQNKRPPVSESQLNDRPSKRKKEVSAYEGDLTKSKNFTANLEALVDGGTLDMVVGDSYLSTILDCIES